MTPERAQIELLKLRLDHLEARSRERDRGSPLAVLFGILLFQYLPHLPVIGAWLQGLEPATTTLARFFIAIVVASLAFSLALGARNAQARRRLRDAREHIFLSISPSSNVR